MSGQGYNIRMGGLLRCCLSSLDGAMKEATEPPKEGDTLSCKCCGDGMVYHADAWEWKGVPPKPLT